MTSRSNRRRTEKGNILFLILLAVVLFAALSYAVTQSTRGGGNDANSESVRVGSAQIMQFMAQVDTAFLRMRTTGNIPIQNISFEYRTTDGNGTSGNNYINTNCTSDSCRVFRPDGGGASPASFQQYANANPTGWNVTWPTPGHYDYYTMQWPGAGTDANDIVMRFIGMDPLICNEINRNVGIVSQPTFSGTSSTAYIVSNWDGAAYTCSTNCAQLMGRDTMAIGSATRGGGNSCNIYHLLITR